MNKLFKVSHIAAGFAVVLVGYSAAVVIIIQLAEASGANELQTQSWLLSLGLVMGLSSIGFSYFYRVPIVAAWSTPGAIMLLAYASDYTLAELTGGFVISGVLIFITGLIQPIVRVLQGIPPALGAAMLGAILLPFCVQAFAAVASVPHYFFPMLLVFLLAKHYLPKYAMLALLVSGLVCAYLEGSIANADISLRIATFQWVTPVFHANAIVNVALPLYLITMLSQNLPGVAILQTHGYQAPLKSLLLGTGLSNAALAPFGAFSANLSAITAAICMNDDVDPDKNERFRAAIWAGVFYLLAALFSASIVALFLSFPVAITQILAGFALLGTLLMCMEKAFQEEASREAALFTFLMTLSGVTFMGIGSVVWGLIAGLILLKLKKQ